MDRNLGASQVATSATDEAAYGDLYQWGRDTDGHEKRTSATRAELSSGDSPGHADFITNGVAPYDWRSTTNDNLWQGVDGVNNPCPAGFRLPTSTELQTEIDSWSSSDIADAFPASLKLNLTGYRRAADGSVQTLGTNGNYWSGTPVGTSARRLSFYAGRAYLDISARGDGLAVRCIKDTTPPPPADKIVFATSATHNGDFGGLAGADAVCQSEADTAGLEGEYKAWLSTAAEPVSSRFSHATVPYTLPDGTTVADNWTDLTSGTIQHAINMTASGSTLASASFMTSTDENGTHKLYNGADANCQNWTTASSAYKYGVGSLAADDTWSYYGTTTCNNSKHLYCFQQ